MAQTVDFKLINRVDGSDLSVVMPMNQDAFDYLEDEWYLDCLPCVQLWTQRLLSHSSMTSSILIWL